MTLNTTDDYLVAWLKEEGRPLTRNVYLAIAFPEGEPDPWTAEDEMMLPKEIQLDSQATPTWSTGNPQ
jgi:hypothetical protein